MTFGVSSHSASTAFWQTFFQGLSEKEETPPKNFIDQAVNLANTTDGAWDFFHVLEQPFAYLPHLSSLKEPEKALMRHVGSVFNSAALALSLPKTLVDANDLHKNAQQLMGAIKTPYSDPKREAKVAQATTKTFLGGITLGNTITQAGLFLNQAKIIILSAKDFFWMDAISHITSFLSDGADLILQGLKLRYLYAISSVKDITSNQKEKLAEEQHLAFTSMLRDIISVALSTIALTGILFSISLETVLLLPETMLVLGSIWLFLKLYCTFYEKIVVEAPMQPAFIRV